MASVHDHELLAHTSSLQGKVVLITGAATGLGKAAALKFAQYGAKVVIGDVDVPRSLDVVDEISAMGGQALSQKCDVTSWDEQVALFQLAVTTFGKVDIVIPNAGVSEDGSFCDVQAENGVPCKPDLRTVDVNLIGVIHTARLAAYYLKLNPSKDKALIFIGSIASVTGLPFAPLYVASKHALIGLARTMYTTMHEDTRICLIAPWFADTEILGPPIRALLAGIPFAKIPRIVGSVVLSATDPNPETNGSIYTIPDDGKVFRISRQELTDGGYGLLQARVHRYRQLSKSCDTLGWAAKTIRKGRVWAVKLALVGITVGLLALTIV